MKQAASRLPINGMTASIGNVLIFRAKESISRYIHITCVDEWKPGAIPGFVSFNDPATESFYYVVIVL